MSPTTLRKQAQWVAPSLTFTNVPDVHSYQRLLRMTYAVTDKLESAGHEPRDMFDVTGPRMAFS